MSAGPGSLTGVAVVDVSVVVTISGTDVLILGWEMGVEDRGVISLLYPCSRQLASVRWVVMGVVSVVAVAGGDVVLVWVGARAGGWGAAGVCVAGAGSGGVRWGQAARKWLIPPQRVQAPVALLSWNWGWL